MKFQDDTILTVAVNVVKRSCPHPRFTDQDPRSEI